MARRTRNWAIPRRPSLRRPPQTYVVNCVTCKHYNAVPSALWIKANNGLLISVLYPSVTGVIVSRTTNIKTFISIVLASTSFAYAAALPSTYHPGRPGCFVTNAGDVVCPPGSPYRREASPPIVCDIDGKDKWKCPDYKLRPRSPPIDCYFDGEGQWNCPDYKLKREALPPGCVLDESGTYAICSGVNCTPYFPIERVTARD